MSGSGTTRTSRDVRCGAAIGGIAESNAPIQSAGFMNTRPSNPRDALTATHESGIGTRLPIRDVGFHSGRLTLPTTPLHKLICMQGTVGAGCQSRRSSFDRISRLRIALFAAGFYPLAGVAQKGANT